MWNAARKSIVCNPRLDPMWGQSRSIPKCPDQWIDQKSCKHDLPNTSPSYFISYLIFSWLFAYFDFKRSFSASLVFKTFKMYIFPNNISKLVLCIQNIFLSLSLFSSFYLHVVSDKGNVHYETSKHYMLSLVVHSMNDEFEPGELTH